MLIKPIKTNRVTLCSASLEQFIKQSLPPLKEKSIVCLTSKVLSYIEGSVVGVRELLDKNELIRQEAEEYLVLKHETYGKKYLTIKRSTFIGDSGVDLSIDGNYYLLWPKDPQRSANDLKRLLTRTYNLNEVGVILTDSRSLPLRRGQQV